MPPDDITPADTSKGEAVGDTAYAIDVPGVGTMEVYESVNKTRYYIAPQLSFALLDPPQVARLSGAEAEGKVECELSLVMVAPDVRAAVAMGLASLLGKEVNVGNVGNLRVYALSVDVLSEEYRTKYGLQSFTIQYPSYSQKLDVAVMVEADTAKEFVNTVNDGGITFKLSYVFKDISLDNRMETLDISLVRSSKSLQNLDEQGKDLFSAKQMAESATQILRDITSTVVEGLGTIEPSSLPISKLLDIFSVGETWKKDDAELAELDDRIRKQFSLGVKAEDFQPFRVQKHVIESLNQATDTATRRSNYASEYNNDKTSFEVSGGFGIGPFSVSSGYSSEAQKVTDDSQMSDDQFKEMVNTYHGAEYNTEENLFRGAKVYDLQNITSKANTSLTSVVYKPSLSSGIRNLTVRPSIASLAKPVPTASNAPIKFYFNYMGDATARHDWYQIDAATWIESFPNGDTRVFKYQGRGVVDGNLGTTILDVTGSTWLFIPDRNASGTFPTYMRAKTSSGGSWGTFQIMLGIE